MPSQKYMKVPTPATSEMETSPGDGNDVPVAGSGTGIPSTDSSQHLIADTESASSINTSVNNSRQYDGTGSVKYAEWFAMFVLCFVNLINYMDRFTIAGRFIYLYSFCNIYLYKYCIVCNVCRGKSTTQTKSINFLYDALRTSTCKVNIIKVY